MNCRKILVILICSLLFVGCNSAKDETVNVSKISNDENIDINKINKDNIVSTLCGTCKYAVAYSSIKELADNSEAVIYGEVTEIQYLVGANGLSRTNMKVKILHSLKGNYEVGQTINIVKDQGIITVSDYLESFVSETAREINRKDFSNYSDNELDDIYIQQIEANDIMSQTGQRSIFFLTKSTFYDTEQTYTRLIGPAAEYFEISKNQFIQTQITGSKLTQPYILSSTENIDVDEEIIPSYTLEEIISEMNLPN